MKKTLNIIVILALVGGVIAFGSQIGQNYSERQARQQIESEASVLYMKIYKEVQKPDGNLEQIQEWGDQLLTEYPDSSLAIRVKSLLNNAETLISNAQKAIEAEKAEKEKARLEVIDAMKDFWSVADPDNFRDYDTRLYWYNFFTEEERLHIISNSPAIGDRKEIISFLPGRYERKESITASGTTYRYYGRGSDLDTKYAYITTDYSGRIDYISTK